ncbi:hypothetical protein BHM03_00007229 [Ensete ventricosum]|nr:hypothetical protein BHM03_00007229 [Ensete ventricosum]
MAAKWHLRARAAEKKGGEEERGEKRRGETRPFPGDWSSKGPFGQDGDCVDSFVCMPRRIKFPVRRKALSADSSTTSSMMLRMKSSEESSCP